MEAATWGFIGTLAGAIVGASASIITTILTGWNSRKLQEDAASLERSERARQFQRSNLLEFQDALLAQMRLIGRAHLEDVESFRNGDDGGRKPLLSERLDQELLISNRKLSILTERIADNSLRGNIEVLREAMTHVLFAKSEDDSREALQNASLEFENVMKCLGVVLRSSISDGANR